MRDPDLDFPPSPYREEIEARLCVNPFPEDLTAWTCDQAAQILSDIDPYAFNQHAAYNFERICNILQACVISNEIDTFEFEGKKYLKPLAVLEWAITDAKYQDYDLPPYISVLYERKRDKQKQITIPLETKEVSKRELTQWLREAWEKENKPGGTAFFTKLKSYVNQKGSPIVEHYTAGDQLVSDGELAQEPVATWQKRQF